jgi:PAS domain S-box-containing protein
MTGDRHEKEGRKSLEDHHSFPAEGPTDEGSLQEELERIIGQAIDLRQDQAGEDKDRAGREVIGGLDADVDYANFYREFIEKSNDAMYVVDLFGNFKFVNSTAARLMGYTKEELLGENIAGFLYPEGLRKAVSIIASLVRGKDVPPHEMTVKTASGDRNAELSVTLVRKEGFPIGILGVARDITERTAAARDLRTSEARLRAVIDSVPFDFFALDREGRYIMQNSVCRENWGDIIGKTPADLGASAETVRQWEDSNRRALAGETVRSEIVRHRDGEERRYYDVLSPVRDDGAVTAVLGISMDVSEQRRTEDLVRAQRDLAGALAAVGSLEEGLEICLSAACEVSGMESGGIYLLEPASGALKLVMHRNLSDDFVNRVRDIAADSPQAEIVNKGVPVFTNRDSLPEEVSASLAREDLRALAALPILHDRKVIGCMNISSLKFVEVPAAAREALESIASQMGSVIVRLRVKEELRESEKRYRELIGSLPVVSWTSDSEGNTVFISPNVTEIYGFTPEEIYESGDKLFFGRLHLEDRPATESAYQALFEKDAAFDIEYRIRHRDGRWLWLHDRAYSRRNEKGTTYAVGVFHDITQRREAEEALRESEERYRSLVEHSRELIFTTSPEGVFTFANRALETLTDWSVEEFLGRPFSEFIHPGDLPVVRGRFARILDGENLPDSEVRLRMKSGETRSFEYSSSRLLRKGELAGIWGVARDITDRKRIEEDRRNLVALKEREGISRWLHDNLGADLYNIILLTDSIQKQEPGSAVLQQQLDWITETSRKSLASIRNYLDFSNQTGFTFEGLVAHMEEYGKSLLNPLGTQFIFGTEGDMSACNLSGVQTFSIYLIFKESLTNIVKHARASTVEVLISHRAGKLDISIEDNGKGFAADAVLAGSFGTTNLRTRADEMGADLRVDTSPLKGTRVAFSLPLAASSSL